MFSTESLSSDRGSMSKREESWKKNGFAARVSGLPCIFKTIIVYG